MGSGRRILHIILVADVGGLEKLVFDLARFFSHHGDEVEVVCLRHVNQDYIANFENCTIPVHLFCKRYRFDFLYFFRLSNFIRKKAFDVVHAHSGCFLDGSLCGRLAGVKVCVYTAHGLPVDCGWKARLKDIFSSFFCDRIVAVSSEIQEVFGRWILFNRKKIMHITNGIDVDLFSPVKDPVVRRKLVLKYEFYGEQKRIGSVGRLAREKNYTMLIRSFHKLRNDSNIEIELLFIGAGPEEFHLRQLVQELHLSEHVRFMGVQHAIHELLPLLDVFVLSSYTEGTSISLLEAQACGVPAVVTDVGGNSSVVIEGETGLLCRVDDVGGMANCIRKFLEDESFAEKCSFQARARVKAEFSLEAMAHRYAELYDR